MHKRLLFLVLLAASGAVHAQDVLIPGRQLTAGKADAQLAQMAREAAREHKVLVVNAPSYWQARIAKAIHAADPAADIRFNDSFFEHVLIRLSDHTAAATVAAAPAPPPHAPAPVVRAEPPRHEVRAPELRTRARSAVQPAAETPAAAVVDTHDTVAASAPTPAPAPVAATPTPVVHALPASLPPPAAPVATASPAAASPAQDSAVVDAALRLEMQQVLNAGRPAFGNLHESQLDPGDVVYVNGGLRAVVRRDALGQTMYWLTGSVNLDRAQYRPLGQGRYEVIGSIDPMAPLQLRSGSDAAVFDSRLPAAASPVRVQLQRLYADGRSVDAKLGVSDLRSGDVLYVGTDAALIVRQDSYGRSRYWLVGRLALGQAGLQRIGPNVYRVIGIVK